MPRHAILAAAVLGAALAIPQQSWAHARMDSADVESFETSIRGAGASAYAAALATEGLRLLLEGGQSGRMDADGEVVWTTATPTDRHGCRTTVTRITRGDSTVGAVSFDWCRRNGIWGKGKGPR
jgi:hypothetical protein